MDPLDKAILVSIYSSGFDSGITPYDYFKSRTIVPEDLFNSRLKKLNKLGFVDLTDPVSLSFLGRGSIKVVLVGGVFDILHPGHIHTLKVCQVLWGCLSNCDSPNFHSYEDQQFASNIS